MTHDLWRERPRAAKAPLFGRHSRRPVRVVVGVHPVAPCKIQFSGVEFGGQYNGPDDPASLFPDPAARNRRLAVPADEIVHHRVFAALADIAFATRLAGEATVTLDTRAKESVDLRDHPRTRRDAQGFQ